MGITKIHHNIAQALKNDNVDKKTEVKPQVLRFDTPKDNAAIIASRHEVKGRADALRTKLHGMVAAAVAPAVAATTLTPEQAAERADEIIKNNGGRDNLDTDGVGRDLAEIAKTDPAAAYAITQAMLGDRIDQDDKGKIKENDKDEIAQSFAQHLSDSELGAIGQNADGKALLDKLRSHLLAGRVHGDERADALRLETAAKGYKPPQLTGNPEEDIKTIAADLQSIPADKRDEYLMEVLKSPFGPKALQRAGVLDDAGRDALAGAIDQAYAQNKGEVTKQLNAILDMDRNFPVYEWTGLADVIRRTGNDELIAGYAKHAMTIANGGGEEKGAWSVDALTALGGMSPEGLENFIHFGSSKPPMYGSPSQMGTFIESNKAQFNQMFATAAGFLGTDANNAGFANPWAFNPAMGDFLNVVNQMTDANGDLSPAALDIFAKIAGNTGDNLFTKEALGKIFIEHGIQISNHFGQRLLPDGSANTNHSAEVLRDFFHNVVYSPISSLLTYNGGSLVEAIVGDENGRGGVIGEIADSIMERATQPGAKVDYLGDELGTLFGALSGGFLKSVQDYKDQFDEDKSFRDFIYGIVNKGLGKLAGRVGVPLDKIGEFVENLIEAGKKDERSAQLEAFKSVFTDLVDSMSQQLINFARDNPNAYGLDQAFRNSWTAFVNRHLLEGEIDN